MSDELPLRDKDQVVLQKIRDGHDDIQKITSTTTLENHEVNYCFTKLEDLNLITVEKPDGYIKRVVDGQRRVFEAPKKAELTRKGRSSMSENDVQRYQNMELNELVERVQELENQVDQLQKSLDMFKRQVRDNL